MLAPLKVKDFMNGTKLTFTPDMDVLAAIDKLVELKLSGAPVVDNHGHFSGFLSEKDCMNIALKSAYESEVAGKVTEFMHNECVTVDVDESVLEVAQIFLDHEYRSLPVTKDNRLVGSITRHDILKALQHNYSD